MKAGTLTSDDIQISAFEYEGQIVSANSRGLAALSKAGLQPSNVRLLDASEVSEELTGRLLQTPVVGEVLPATEIAVTEMVGGEEVILEVIALAVLE